MQNLFMCYGTSISLLPQQNLSEGYYRQKNFSTDKKKSDYGKVLSVEFYREMETQYTVLNLVYLPPCQYFGSYSQAENKK